MDFIKKAAEGIKGHKDKGTQAQGTQAQGTQAQGTQAQGTQAQGTQAQGTQAQGAPAQGGEQQDYVDKAFGMAASKSGHNIDRNTQEKITDAGRGAYEKATGTKVDPKYSN